MSVHSAMGQDLCLMGIMHCKVMLGNTQFLHTFVCKSLEKEPVIGLDMQQLHCLGCGRTDSGHMF